MAINTHKTRDGEIVSVKVLRALLATGNWQVTGISQVVDGKSYWHVDNFFGADYCLASAEDCEEIAKGV